MVRKMNVKAKTMQFLAGSFIVFSLVLTVLTPACALEVPISQEEHMIDGKQTIVQVFEVSPELDPDELIQRDLVRGEYSYEMTSIIKEPLMTRDVKEITKEYTVTVDVSDKEAGKEKAM